MSIDIERLMNFALLVVDDTSKVTQQLELCKKVIDVIDQTKLDVVDIKNYRPYWIKNQLREDVSSSISTKFSGDFIRISRVIPNNEK